MIQELFSGPVGLISVFTLVFTIGMAVFFLVYFQKKISEDENRKK
jgi:hypothetical protein